MVIKDAEIFSKGVLHTLTYSKDCSHGFLALISQAFLDVLLVKEQVEHRDFGQADSRVLGNAPKQEGQRLILYHDQIVPIQLVELLYLRYPFCVRDLTVMLRRVLTTKENDCILPLVAHPALTALHPCPFCRGMHFEMRIL